MNSLAHIEVNVSNLKTSTDFYSKILGNLGWELVDMESAEISGFKAPDNTHLFLVQTNESHLNSGFHRKRVGLNHLAFRVSSQEAVEEFSQYLDSLKLPKLYHPEPKDYSSEYKMEKYNAVFFEDPDRMKLEVVFVE